MKATGKIFFTAMLCLVFFVSLMPPAAFAGQQKGFLVRLWERISSTSVETGDTVSEREVRGPERKPAAVKETQKKEDVPPGEEGFLLRLWRNIRQRITGETVSRKAAEITPRERPALTAEDPYERVIPESIQEKAFSRTAVLSEIQAVLTDKPYLVDVIPDLSFKRSVMDGEMHYYYASSDGTIPLKISDLDREGIMRLRDSVRRASDEYAHAPSEIAEGGPFLSGEPGVPGQVPGFEDVPPYSHKTGMPDEGLPARQIPAQTGIAVDDGSLPGEIAARDGESISPGEADFAGEGPAGIPGIAPPALRGPEGLPVDEADEPVAPEPVQPETPEEKPDREIPLEKEEMLDVLYKRLKVFSEILYIVPNLYAREGIDGAIQYYYAPGGGMAVRIEDLEKTDLFDLYVRVNNEATRLNTERMLKQIQQQEQLNRNLMMQQRMQQQMQQQMHQPPPQPPRVYTPPQPPPQPQQPPPQPPQPPRR